MPVPLVGTGVKRHVPRGCREFWLDPEAAKWGERKGCYAFGIQHGKSVRLTYVGKAAKTIFRTECFAEHKVRDHYNPSLRARKNGKAVLFLIVAPAAKPPVKRIDDLESFLIATAVSNKVQLTNKRKRGERAWYIPGVAYSPKGRPTNPAKALRIAARVAS